MKLEVGMYVRYYWFNSEVKVGKITKIIDNLTIYINDKDVIPNYKILKASASIIDVIEIGDYIEGTVLVTDKNDKWIIVYDNPRVIGKEEGNELIYSVETKEQFELNRLINVEESAWNQLSKYLD